MFKKILLILPLLLGGCISTYLDNAGPQVDYKDISRRAQPIPVTIEATGTVNGDIEESTSKRIGEKARQTIINSQVFSVADNTPAAGKIKIKLDERFNHSGTFARGFLTGFTFGLVGTTSEEDIVMDISLEMPGKPQMPKQYSQKLYLNVGLTALTPDNSTKFANDIAYDEVIKRLILSYIRDLQKEGAI